MQKQEEQKHQEEHQEEQQKEQKEQKLEEQQLEEFDGFVIVDGKFLKKNCEHCLHIEIHNLEEKRKQDQLAYEYRYQKYSEEIEDLKLMKRISVDYWAAKKKKKLADEWNNSFTGKLSNATKFWGSALMSEGKRISASLWNN